MWTTKRRKVLLLPGTGWCWGTGWEQEREREREIMILIIITIIIIIIIIMCMQQEKCTFMDIWCVPKLLSIPWESQASRHACLLWDLYCSFLIKVEIVKVKTNYLLLYLFSCWNQGTIPVPLPPSHYYQSPYMWTSWKGWRKVKAKEDPKAPLTRTGVC